MRHFFYIGFLLTVTPLFSQNGDNLHKEDRGNIIIKQNNEIKGNDYLYDEWNKGMLVLNDSVFSIQDYLKYDVINDVVLIKNNGISNNVTDIIEINDKSVTGFSILEKEKNIKHDFVHLRRKNFKDDAENGFYEVVFNLKNTNYFIKKNSKILFDPNRSKGSQTMNNYPLEYQDKITYYLKNSDGLYVEIKLKKKDITAVLNKHPKDVEIFIKLNKVNYGKEVDIAKLVNYYYEL